MHIARSGALKQMLQNVIAAVVFRNEETFDGEWLWGNSASPHLDYYNYLGVKFAYDGHWDAYIKDLVTEGKHTVNTLSRILHNPCLSLYVKRQIILSILHLSLEYGSEVWKYTSSQSKTFAVCKRFYIAPQGLVVKLYGVI